MSAAWPSAPFRVLDEHVDLVPLTGEPGQGWTRIECASKKAYGCGKSIEAAVQGLTLYVRLGDGPLVTSTLVIRLSDEALRGFYSEPDEPVSRRKVSRRKERCNKHAVGCVLQAKQDFIAIGLSFRGDCPEDLFYFLLYDNIDASLFVISYLPDPYKATMSLQPVLSRTVGGACEMLLMVREMTCVLPPVLCVYSPATWANSACPWQIKGMMRFPLGEIDEPFRSTTSFSFQGKVFWADLAQGLVYYDLHATGDCNSTVDLGFIKLPDGCKLEGFEVLKLMDEPSYITQRVGCSEDSIWFICIDCPDYGDDWVTMWTLQSHDGRWSWKEEWKFSTTELWGFDGFKEAGLPKTPLEFPVLTAEGHLSVVLTDQHRPSEYDVVVGHICGIDVPNKRVLWHGKVHDYPFSEPVMCPSSFFQRKHGSHKRKFGD